MMFTPKAYKNFFGVVLMMTALFAVGVSVVSANAALAVPPFSQDWSNTSLITTSDDWSNVPSIIGYLGDYSASTPADVDPQTLLSDYPSVAVDVIANLTNVANTTGGVAEFQLADPTIAMQGSGTADAPFIKIFLNTTGMNNIRVAYNVRDIDNTADNAVQQVALHYRVGSSGNFTNVSAAYVADATTGNLATLVTPVDVILPAAASNQPHVELRIMTTNATNNDEWVGIDDISVTANYAPTGISLSSYSVLENQPTGTTIGTMTGIDPNVGDTHTFELVTSCALGGMENVYFSIVGDELRTAAIFDREAQQTYIVCMRAVDNNGLVSSGLQYTIEILDIADETPPSVSIEQASGQPDPTNVSPINFTVTFSEPVTGFDENDINLGGTAGAATANVTEIFPNDGTTYNVAVSGMALDGDVTASVIADAAEDGTGNKSTASTSADNTVTFSTDTTFPIVLFSVNTIPANGSVLTVGPSQIQIEFNEDVKSDFGMQAANNTNNYMLVEAGANGMFDTTSCFDGHLADDVSIMVNAASYNNSAFIATLVINGGAPLGAGVYRLFVCGTTSIEDLIGNELNDGLSDTLISFTVRPPVVIPETPVTVDVPTLLPLTGFPKGELTRTPAQPLEKTYASYADLQLVIPSLAVSTPIVGVPLHEDDWDVTWLGADAGWLNGTAFPTWSGNSVITAHVWDAYNQPGTFHNLKKLKYGDVIQVRAFGQIYTYEVRETKRISPKDVNTALKHEEKAWLTLVTCEDYKFLFRTYSYRRMVRAVLVSVTPEK
jgi:LPXTG-site transpeptidase (sortase) family protein